MRPRGGSRMVLLAATLGALCASDEFSLPAFIQDQQRFQEPPHGQSAAFQCHSLLPGPPATHGLGPGQLHAFWLRA